MGSLYTTVGMAVAALIMVAPKVRSGCWLHGTSRRSCSAI